MSREKRLNIRITEQEWQKLKAFTDGKNWTMAEAIRFYINSLPDPKV